MDDHLDSESEVEEVDGELDVSEWLANLAPAFLQSKEIMESTSDPNEYSKMFVRFRGLCIAALTGGFDPHPHPPRALIDALWFTSSDGLVVLKSLRSDLYDLKVQGLPLARILLLACSKKRTMDTGAAIADVSMTDEERRKYLQKGWTQPYQGDALDLFLLHLEHCQNIYDGKRFYGRAISLLQSSGCGKSRLVAELGRKYPVCATVFRESTNPSIGWPPADPHAVQFFLNDKREKKFYGEELAAAFLGALADVVVARSNTGKLEPGLFDRDRNQLFQKATETANSSLHNHWDQLQHLRNSISDSPLSTSHPSPPHMEKDDSGSSNGGMKGFASTWRKELFQLLCETSLKTLSVKVGFGQFFFAFDECSLLGDSDGTPVQRMTLLALQHIIKEADEYNNLWFLLLDTSSSVLQLHPSGPSAPSFRLVKGMSPLPAFSALPFNEHLHLLSKRSPRHSVKFSNLKKCGRPLWSTYHDCDVLEIAKQKLLNAEPFDAGSSQHVLAVFANRACLEIAAHHTESPRFASEAIGSHMRVLTSIRENYLDTYSPSEPMLAIAAAAILNDGQDKTYSQAFLHMKHHVTVQTPVLDTGELGEYCTRLLLLLARDKATVRLHKSFIDNVKHEVFIIPLSAFLTELLGPNFGLPMSHRNINDLQSFCHNKWINFTHFARLDRIINDLTLKEVKSLWFTGAAIQCAHNQPVIDQLFVVYSGSLDEDFQASNLIVIGLQSKAKECAANPKTVGGLTVPPILFPTTSGEPSRVKNQSIVILMDLGARSKFQGSDSQIQLTLRSVVKTAQWSGYVDHEPRNFFFNLQGCSLAQYPVLKDFGKSFGALLNRLPVSELHSSREIHQKKMLPMSDVDSKEDKDDVDMEIANGVDDNGDIVMSSRKRLRTEDE